MNINNPTIKYISGFVKAKEKAMFQCSICGKPFESQAFDVYSGNIGCPKCYKNKGINNVIKRLKINNPSIEYVKGYIDPHKKATFKCKKCGYIWETITYEIYTGNRHCPNCSKQTKLFSENDIRERLKFNNPSIIYVGNYTGSLNKAKFRCSKCENVWDAFAFAIYNGKIGCPKCAYSKGENCISQYLENRNIDYETQWTFQDCKNIFPLPFDFFIPNKNTCIEYDGEHHFIPVIRSKSTTMEQAKENLKNIQFRDKIKTDYCKNNNIKLIRIPYTEFNNIEKILDTYFNYNITI